MKFLKLAKKNKAISPESWTALYEHTVVKKVRAKYTLNQELAILRKELAILRQDLAILLQRDTKPAEFAEYNAVVEIYKSEAKSELEM